MTDRARSLILGHLRWYRSFRERLGPGHPSLPHVDGRIKECEDALRRAA